VRAGVVHLGLGAFHRAHQALVFDDALAAGDEGWAVVGVSMRSAAVRDRLVPQDELYTVIVENHSEREARVVGALLDVLVAPEEPRRVIEAIADPGVHLVTLTITEKGYHASGSQSAAGLIAAGLSLRRHRKLRGLTVMSCDNLPNNGEQLRAAVWKSVGTADAGFADWIAMSVTFPSTMVDRIVPATTAGDIEQWRMESGLEDQALVRTEPYWQWVVEDRFAGAIPDLGALGVTLTADVRPWEQAKLRLLNGAHSAMAYLGGLAGLKTVDNFVRAPFGEPFLRSLWDESAPTLMRAPGLDLAQYCNRLIERFGNRALEHRLEQIAIDGSQKIPQRIVAPLLDRLAAGAEANALGLALAAWMRWQQGVNDLGRGFTVDDPLAKLTSPVAGDAAALLGLEQIFPPAARANPALVKLVSNQLRQLETLGARGAIEAMLTHG
jgi:fructuronate reductase